MHRPNQMLIKKPAGNELETCPMHLLTEQFQSLLLGGHVAELNAAEPHVVRVLHPR